MSKKKKQKVILYILQIIDSVAYINTHTLSWKINIHWRVKFVVVEKLIKEMEENKLIYIKHDRLYYLTNKGKLMLQI